MINEYDKCVVCGDSAEVKISDIDNAPVCYDCMSWGTSREEIKAKWSEVHNFISLNASSTLSRH